MIEVLTQYGRKGRLEQGGLPPGHQPRQAAQLVRQGDARGPQITEPSTQPPLMVGIAVAMQQGHGDASVAIGHRLVHLAGQGPIEL